MESRDGKENATGSGLRWVKKTGKHSETGGGLVNLARRSEIGCQVESDGVHQDQGRSPSSPILHPSWETIEGSEKTVNSEEGRVGASPKPVSACQLTRAQRNCTHHDTFPMPMPEDLGNGVIVRRRTIFPDVVDVVEPSLIVVMRPRRKRVCVFALALLFIAFTITSFVLGFTRILCDSFRCSGSPEIWIGTVLCGISSIIFWAYRYRSAHELTATLTEEQVLPENSPVYDCRPPDHRKTEFENTQFLVQTWVVHDSEGLEMDGQVVCQNELKVNPDMVDYLLARCDDIETIRSNGRRMLSRYSLLNIPRTLFSSIVEGSWQLALLRKRHQLLLSRLVVNHLN
jgi:hypothetical protein